MRKPRGEENAGLECKSGEEESVCQWNVNPLDYGMWREENVEAKVEGREVFAENVALEEGGEREEGNDGGAVEPGGAAEEHMKAGHETMWK